MSHPGYPDGGQQDPNQPPHQPGPGPYPQGQPFGGPMPPYGQGNFKPLGDPGTLDLPWYGIGFGQAISRAFKKYVRFDGRASRGEFWWFYLFNAIVSFVLSIPYTIVSIQHSIAIANGAAPSINTFSAWQIPSSIWGLIVLLPNLGLFWRRLHDTNRSGAWWFLFFACGIGGIVPLIMCIMDTNPEGRRFDRVQTGPGYGGGYQPGGYPPSAG